MQKKIYRKEENQDNKTGSDLEFRKTFIKSAGNSETKNSESEANSGSAGIENLPKESLLEKKKKERTHKKFLYIFFISAGVIITASISALFYFLKFKTAFREKDIIFKLAYPEEIENGEEFLITIDYGNFSKVNLKDSVITIRRSADIEIMGEESAALAKEFKIGDMPPGISEKIEIPARIFGGENGYYIEAVFQYTPENFNSAFRRSESGKIKISSTPVKIILDAPKDAASGRNMQYNIACENASDKDFSDLILTVEYPEGFMLESVEEIGFMDIMALEIGKDDNILINNLRSGEKAEYLISGSLSGEIGYGQIIKAKIGFKENEKFYSYDQAEASTTIKESELLIIQTIENNVQSLNAGEYARFEILVKNTSQTGLAGVEIFSQLEGEAIDYSSVNVSKGVISSDNIISWNSSGISSFAYFLPSQEVKLSFSLRVKDRLPIKNMLDKNFSFSSSPAAKAIELEETLAGNPLNIKINSKLIFSEKGFYYDSALKNFGPIPPKAGQTTAYAIHWQLLNLANDANSVKIKAVLPAGIGWSANTKAERGNLYFDNISRVVIWDIGTVPANVGIASPIYEAIFQISASPAQADIGKALQLIGEAAVSGIDEFTGTELSAKVSYKTTELYEDEKIGGNGYKVSY